MYSVRIFVILYSNTFQFYRAIIDDVTLIDFELDVDANSEYYSNPYHFHSRMKYTK